MEEGTFYHCPRTVHSVLSKLFSSKLLDETMDLFVIFIGSGTIFSTFRNVYICPYFNLSVDLLLTLKVFPQSRAMAFQHLQRLKLAAGSHRAHYTFSTEDQKVSFLKRKQSFPLVFSKQLLFPLRIFLHPISLYLCSLSLQLRKKCNTKR